MVEADVAVGYDPLAADTVSRSRLVRYLLIAAGTLCVALGVLGAVLPLLPTTPFLLLAAACFARSSAPLHRWLHTNRFFGDYLRRYRAGEGLPLRAKHSILAILYLSLGYSAATVPAHLAWIRLPLLAIAVGASVQILRMKTHRS
jgi:uncharacterized membrane protein YbaN (DUF454 family)